MRKQAYKSYRMFYLLRMQKCTKFSVRGRPRLGLGVG